jgi:transposase
VTTDFGAGSGLTAGDAADSPGPSSACDPYRETIELGLSRGRNAMAIWQDLVGQHGFTGGYQSVKRFVRKLRGVQSPEACAVILTKAGEDYGEFRVMVRSGGDLNFSQRNSAAADGLRYIMRL